MSRPLSVRLDEEAADALDAICAAGLSRSEAIRVALIEAARRDRRRIDLDAEIQALAEDPEDRAEKAEIAELMEALANPR